MTTVIAKVCAVVTAVIIPIFFIGNNEAEEVNFDSTYTIESVATMQIPETQHELKNIIEPLPETTASIVKEEPVEQPLEEMIIPKELPDIVTLNIKLYNDHKQGFNQVDGKTYLNDIRSYLVKYAPDGMFISAACAQSYTEGGAGKAGVYSGSNNCFGIIAGKNWDGYCFSRKTKLVYKDYETAVKYGATDLFRAYDCIEDSVKDYVALISGDYYKGALKTNSPKEYLSYILNKGYGEKESLKVWLEMIELYNLEEFDIEEVQ